MKKRTSADSPISEFSSDNQELTKNITFRETHAHFFSELERFQCTEAVGARSFPGTLVSSELGCLGVGGSSFCISGAFL